MGIKTFTDDEVGPMLSAMADERIHMEDNPGSAQRLAGMSRMTLDEIHAARADGPRWEAAGDLLADRLLEVVGVGPVTADAVFQLMYGQYAEFGVAPRSARRGKGR